MECILINLDSQPERHQQVEENFSKYKGSDWHLHRISAVNIEQVKQSQVQGLIAPPEKGCFMSHLVALNLSRQVPGHVMIVEDDVLFGPRSFEAIETAVNLAEGHDWDILFTDICVPHMQTMLEMYSLRKQLMQGNHCQLVPLEKIVFAGSTAYLVNGKSKDKLIQLLTEKPALDLPYDLTLRQLVYNRRLKGFVAFPFPTSLSNWADDSQIQHEQSKKVADVAWNAFRRLTWLGGSPTVATDTLKVVQDSYFDSECQAFTKILGCMLSTNFVPK